jgi:hypothetical protein
MYLLTKNNPEKSYCVENSVPILLGTTTIQNLV